MVLNIKYLKLLIISCDHVITLQLPIFLLAVFCSEFFIYLYSSSSHPKSLLKYIIMTKVLQYIFKVKEKERCSRVMVSCWYLRAEKSTQVKSMSGKHVWFSIMITLFQLDQECNANVVLLFDKYWYSKNSSLYLIDMLRCHVCHKKIVCAFL